MWFALHSINDNVWSTCYLPYLVNYVANSQAIVEPNESPKGKETRNKFYEFLLI